MTAGIHERDDETGLAGLAPVVSGPPLLGDPVLLGDVVALVVADLGVRRTAATVDPSQVLQFATWSRASKLRAR